MKKESKHENRFVQGAKIVKSLRGVPTDCGRMIGGTSRPKF